MFAGFPALARKLVTSRVVHIDDGFAIPGDLRKSIAVN